MDHMALYGGFPKLGVPFLGLPIIRIIIFGDLYWSPLILGSYHTYIYIYRKPLNYAKVSAEAGGYIGIIMDHMGLKRGTPLITLMETQCQVEGMRGCELHLHLADLPVS